MNVTRYSKAIAAGAAGVAILAQAARDGAITGEEVVTIAVAVASALGVYAVPNNPEDS